LVPLGPSKSSGLKEEESQETEPLPESVTANKYSPTLAGIEIFKAGFETPEGPSFLTVTVNSTSCPI
jgi:hypothetical protein